MMNQKFELQVIVVIREKQVDGQSYNYQNCLEVRETVTVSASSFMEAASILGQFHELSKKVEQG